MKKNFFNSVKKYQEPTIDMTYKILPKPPSQTKQMTYLSQILAPSYKPPTLLSSPENAKKCKSCYSPLATEESKFIGLCFTCRTSGIKQKQRSEAVEKPKPILPPSPPRSSATKIISSPYFSKKRVIQDLYSINTTVTSTTTEPSLPRAELCETSLLISLKKETIESTHASHSTAAIQPTASTDSTDSTQLSESTPKRRRIKEPSKPLKKTESDKYKCDQIVINQNSKRVCPLCKLTQNKRNNNDLCSSCKKQRLNKREKMCKVCQLSLLNVDHFYLCLSGHSFCLSCKRDGGSGEGVCCDRFVKMSKVSKV